MQDLHRHLPGDVDQETAAALIDELAADPAVLRASCCSCPRRSTWTPTRCSPASRPEKDVDGLTTPTPACSRQGRPGLRPCTPAGVMTLLDEYDVPLAGAEAVVVGRSRAGRQADGPAAARRNATVTTCHSRTRDLAEVCRRADVLVVAAGIPGLDRCRRGQAGRDRHRRRHPPRRERPARRRRPRGRRRGGRPDHPGAGRRRADDDRDAAGQHADRGEGPAGSSATDDPGRGRGSTTCARGRRCSARRRREVLTATRPDEVAGVPAARSHDATEAGSWAFGYVAYEAAAGLDPQLPGGAAAPGEPPLVWFGLCDRAGAGRPRDAAARRPAAAVAWLAGLDRRGARPGGRDASASTSPPVRPTSATSPTGCARRSPATPRTSTPAWPSRQRGAYNAYLDLGRHVVASASPELFFEWTGDVVRTRPMKGTARAAGRPPRTARQSRVLRSSAKEQAENLMIVDLLRNDLGRVAEIGSVVVDELFALERYPTVWQMTSQVSARRAAGHGPARAVPRAVPVRIGHRRPQAPHDAAHRATSSRRRAGSTAAPSGWSLPRPPRSGPGSTSPSGPSSSTAHRRGGVRGRRRHHLGLRGRRRNARRCTPRPPSWRHDVAEHRLLETLAFVPATGLRNLDRHLARMADSADWTGLPVRPGRGPGRR